MNAAACYFVRAMADENTEIAHGLRRRDPELLDRLIEMARANGFHKMVLSAFPFNASGMALYERLGFRTVGVYREQGLLDGKWVDTVVMEKLL